MCVKLLPRDLNLSIFTPHTHKHLYLWSGYHTKGVPWYYFFIVSFFPKKLKYLLSLCSLNKLLSLSLSLSMLLNLLGLSISPYLDGLCPITSSYTLGGYLVIFCPLKCRLVVVVVVIIGRLAILKIWVDKSGYVIFWIWVCDCDFIMGIM